MKFIYTALSILLLNFSIYSQIGELIWEDNFNEEQLDLSKWTYETGTGINGDWEQNNMVVVSNGKFTMIIYDNLFFICILSYRTNIDNQ